MTFRLSRPCMPALVAVLGAVLSFGASYASFAQTAPVGASGSTPATSAQPDYHPSMGDLMTMIVQPRHIKLGLSGRARNWTYANYELSELRNAFARVARTIPKYRSTDTAQLLAGMVQAPLDALGRSIAAADSRRFAAAYAELTRACNACHVSQQHAVVVIKAPDAAMFPDQDFRPVR